MPTWRWCARGESTPHGSDDLFRPIWNVWPQEAQDAQAAFPKGGKVDADRCVEIELLRSDPYDKRESAGHGFGVGFWSVAVCSSP